MSITQNTLARNVNNYLASMALPLGLWFISLTLLRYAAVSDISLSFLSTILMVVTPFCLWYIIRGLRQLLGGYILGIQAWTFGAQLSFLAGLLEAAFVYVFNEFIRPGNLVKVAQASIQQYETVLATLKSLGGYESMIPSFEETLETIRETPVSTPIETALSTLSSDLFIGMILMVPIALIVRRMPKLP